MKISRTRSWQIAVAVFLLTITLSSMPITALAFLYHAESMEGKVVDAQTGKPIEGAIVTANWQLEGGTDSGIPRGQLEILETVTDVNGKFVFPAWGPKLSFRWHASFKWPQVLVYKPGYKHLRLTNEPRSGSQYTTKSDWHGKTLSMSSLAGNPEEFEHDRSRLHVSLGFVRVGEVCEWRRIPRLLSAYNKEITESRAESRKTILSRLDVFPNEEECGPYQDLPGLIK